MILATDKYIINSKIPLIYWESIANFLSCCNAKIHNLSSPTYSYARWGEEQIYFQDLLDFLGIPKLFWYNICNEIRCPECNGKINLNSIVSINYSYIESRKYKKMTNLIKNKTIRKLYDFYSYITINPNNGRAHQTGEIIAKEIDNFPLTTISNEFFFRARHLLNNNSKCFFTNEDMLPPPPEKTFEGRYNRPGEPVFYLGNRKSTCIAEINNGNIKNNCWVQKIKVNSDKIIDISNYYTTSTLSNIPLFVSGLLLSDIILQHNYSKSETHPEYCITQFIADLCKQKKINGILYPSAVFKKNNGTRGINLVLFNWENKFSFIGQPEQFKYKDNIIELKMRNKETNKIIKPTIQIFSDI